MLRRLSRGPASVSELAEPLTMTFPAVVQHVQVLETSGLIQTEKVGRVRICRLELSRLATVEGWVAARRSAWEARLDRLGEILDAEDA